MHWDKGRTGAGSPREAGTMRAPALTEGVGLSCIWRLGHVWDPTAGGPAAADGDAGVTGVMRKASSIGLAWRTWRLLPLEQAGGEDRRRAYGLCLTQERVGAAGPDALVPPGRRVRSGGTCAAWAAGLTRRERDEFARRRCWSCSGATSGLTADPESGP